ncbi:MAG: ATP synthase F1 subunit epsilon [Anaerohalosphaera sp.]|nr:ATP synthase F1 subunit epsilon [Anaerohalosphaera sp.]
MVSLSVGTFKCVLMTPEGTLLDCKASAVTLPGHDGSLGILRNHAPMLCKLGLGIMVVRGVVDSNDSYYLLEGGFARVSQNSLTVLAYDAISLQGMAEDKARDTLARANEIVVGNAYIRRQKGQEFSSEKARLLVKMAEMSGFSL